MHFESQMFELTLAKVAYFGRLKVDKWHLCQTAGLWPPPKSPWSLWFRICRQPRQPLSFFGLGLSSVLSRLSPHMVGWKWSRRTSAQNQLIERGLTRQGLCQCVRCMSGWPKQRREPIGLCQWPRTWARGRPVLVNKNASRCTGRKSAQRRFLSWLTNQFLVSKERQKMI